MISGAKARISFLLALLMCVGAHFTFLDGIEGVIAPIMFRTDTKYSDRYTDAHFRRVMPGMSSESLLELLGKPFHEVWDYSSQGKSCGFLILRDGVVIDTTQRSDCPLPSVRHGMLNADILKSHGTPPQESRFYSVSPSDRSYRQRIVVLANGKVIKRIAEFYVD